MKYYIIAGEPSGDLHGSNLMKWIQKLDPLADFRFWGGDMMLDVDNDGIVTHIRETSIMGFVEVVKNLSRIKSFIKKAKATILDFKPDVVVFIDYPGFNLRMAKWAKRQGCKVAYYISPQLWAWKKGRVHTVRQYVDEMIVILPFELDFYRKYDIEAHFVGHPLLSVIEEYRRENVKEDAVEKKKVIALLPGSRKQEIKKMLPVMMAGAKHFAGEYSLCVAMAPNIEKEFYISLSADQDVQFDFVKDGTYDLLSNADLALVTSGTATLETALFGVPQIVCYKTSTINYEIGRRLVDLKNISLVNLIRGEKIVPELIQHDLNEENIKKNLHSISKDYSIIVEEYKKLNAMLSGPGEPSKLAAEVVVDLAKK